MSEYDLKYLLTCQYMLVNILFLMTIEESIDLLSNPGNFSGIKIKYQPVLRM